MSEIRRYRGCGVDCDFYPDSERGPVVFFTDHEADKAEAVRAAVSERDREWEARIEEKASENDETAGHFAVKATEASVSGEMGLQLHYGKLEEEFFSRAALLRSLLSVDPNTEKEARHDG